MFYDLYSRILAWVKDHRDRSLIFICLSGFFVIGIMILIMDYRISETEITQGITRNDYGQGVKRETLEIRNQDGEVGELQVEISEKTYTQTEIKEVFDRTIQKMDTLILGENESLDHVEKDMNLLTEVPGEPIDVSWELDRYDLMNAYGKLNEEKLVEDGTMIHLQAVLTYREVTQMQAMYECMIVVYPRTRNGNDAILGAVEKEVSRRNEASKEEERLYLPKKVGDTEIAYFYPRNMRGAVIMLTVLLIGGLLIALEKQREGERQAERKRQMALDYPEIISKLTLLLGAGMNVKRAWRKIADDYEHGEKRHGERYAYEEMKYTCREMESGASEAESYEKFGRRCGSQEYLRLGALLSQNLRKGTKGLNDLLKLEAIQAFEERKARARRAGEEAGTKLLGPMFLMLMEVLIVVIVPAFFSVQL